MHNVFRSAGRRLLTVPLALAVLAGCQDRELPTGTVRAPDAPRFSLQLPATPPGTLVAWGSNFYNQTTNVPAGSDFVAVAAGGYHSVGLRSNGTLASWGDDELELVTGTPAGDDFVAVAAGEFHSLALRSNGTIVAWGDNDTDPPEGNDFVAVSAGHLHSVALRSNGTLISWGDDNFSQVSETPVESDFVAVAAGREHSLALRSNGTLVSWGGDYHDEVGHTPPGNDFVAVAAGQGYSLALRLNGTLAAWGSGIYEMIDATPPGNDFVAVAAGGFHGVALRSNGTLVSWGNDEVGQITQTPAGSDFVSAAAGRVHSVAIQAAPAACEGVQIRMTRTAGPGAIEPGASGAWTVELEVTACEAVTEVTAQGGTVGWATTTAATSDGSITVRKANRKNEVLQWQIGAMAAGDIATAVLTVNGTVGRKVACGTLLSIASDWSPTATAGGASVQYDAAGPLTVEVCEP